MKSILSLKGVAKLSRDKQQRINGASRSGLWGCCPGQVGCWIYIPSASSGFCEPGYCRPNGYCMPA